MYGCTFGGGGGEGGRGWGCLYCIGNNVFLAVLACESLHVRTVCIWRCEHARFCVDFLCAIYIKFHSFIDILGAGIAHWLEHRTRD